MSVYAGLYQIYTGDTELANMLATDHEGDPAVFTTWGLRKRNRPYMVLRIRFRPTETDVVRIVDLDVDIFTSGESSSLAETIRDRVIALTHRKTITAVEAGDAGLRMRLTGDGEVPETDEGVVHWNVAFNGRFGPQRIIENLLA